jgi:uncharacterized protein (DUF2062 family)
VTLLPRALTDRVRAAFHLGDPPWRIAVSLAVGVFVSFTPFWGVQTLLALALATVFRLNRVVTLTGTWINLPWFAPFVYAGALALGRAILPRVEGIQGAWVALLVGSTIVGAGAAVATYVLSLAIIARRRARRRSRSGSDQRAA